MGRAQKERLLSRQADQVEVTKAANLHATPRSHLGSLVRLPLLFALQEQGVVAKGSFVSESVNSIEVRSTKSGI